MQTRRAEAATKRGDFAGTQVLIAEHEDRMFGKGALDPVEGRVVEGLGKVDAERLGAQIGSECAQLRCVCHQAFLPRPAATISRRRLPTSMIPKALPPQSTR